MRNELETYLEELKADGLSPEREARFLDELATSETGHAPLPVMGAQGYADGDCIVLRQWIEPQFSSMALIKSLDELLERDRQREEDGFPRKIRMGRLVKPGRGGKGKVVVVPTTVEEKFIHDPTVNPPAEAGKGKRARS
jgi:hypothetical protein